MFESSTIIIIAVIIILLIIGKIFSITRKLLWNAFIGWAMLFLLNSLAPWTGFNLPVNWFTAIGVGIFGLPGLCALTIYHLFFV